MLNLMKDAFEAQNIIMMLSMLALSMWSLVAVQPIAYWIAGIL